MFPKLKKLKFQFNVVIAGVHIDPPNYIKLVTGGSVMLNNVKATKQLAFGNIRSLYSFLRDKYMIKTPFQ